MYEYHGWISVRVSPGEVEDDRQLLRNIKEQVDKLIKDFQEEYRVVGVKIVNGKTLVWVASFTNHEGYESKELLSLFQKIGQIAPGSYGIIYIHNDEDKEGLANEFQVWRLARGTLKKFKDYYLSPCIPIIEDPYPE